MVRPFLVGALGASIGVGLLGVVVNLAVGVTALHTTGCNTDAGTIVIPPTTGILLPAATLEGAFGCGQAVGQVFKYAAVVVDSEGRLVTAQVYDCFADGTFVNLNPSATGSLNFSLLVYAWDEPAFSANQTAIEAAENTINVAASADASVQNPFLAVPATFRTTCDADQTMNIEQLAVCAPLAPPDAGARVVDAGGVDAGGKDHMDGGATD